MARLTPQQMAEKWQRRTTAATPDLQAGVQNVRENPAQLAIAQKQKLRQNWLNAVDSGKWEAGLGRVTLESWKRNMIDKGVPRINAGVQAAVPKFQQFAAELLPYEDALRTEIDAMPSMTLEDSIARMTAWVRGMSNFRR